MIKKKSNLLKFYYLGIQESKEGRKLIELLEDYIDVPAEDEDNKLELYYSPLCPFSRAVWLFCLETGIPIVAHKIDLLKEDQGLDQAYKKFSQLSQSLQVPLLKDGEFVLEESVSICMYLCDKYFVGTHWLPKTDKELFSKVYQQLEFLSGTIQIEIQKLWEYCKNPKTGNFSSENFKDFYDQIAILNEEYSRERKRIGLNPKEIYFQSDKPSLVDIFTILILSFAQLIQGFSVNKYENLRVIYKTFMNQFSKKNWKVINYEFEGFLKYIITVTNTTGNSTNIQQTILFQQTPLTIYEQIQDPENDIFLFLASKTISVKTNAKLKKGLKKLNETDSEQDDEENNSPGQKEELPYIVNLDIGGEFNIHGREGTNLLLVPGKKIVQTSRMSSWESGYLSTVIFEFETIANSQALLHFTELNCPSETLKVQEDFWLKFWKKINGTRVDSINQTIVFKTKGPEMLFNILTDFRLLSKTIKSKIKILDGDNGVLMYNNKIYTKILSTIKNKKILQNWRSSDWIEDLYCYICLDLEGYEGGCRIRCNIDMVPFDRIKQVEKLWKSNMWKKLAGVVCGSVEQNITFLHPPDHICAMFLDGNILSSKLKSKCLASNDVGSQFSVAHLKGTLLQYQEGKKIVLCVSHKDWSNHNSLVTLNLSTIEKGTSIHMIHENIPQNSIKSISDMWNTEFWDKLEGIRTTSISSSCILNTTSAETLFKNLLEKSSLSEILGSESSISKKISGNVSLYDKLIKGTVTSIEQNAAIVMSLRYFNWPFSHCADARYQLDEINGGKGTVFTLSLDHVPLNHVSEASKHNEELCKQLKKYKFKKL